MEELGNYKILFEWNIFSIKSNVFIFKLQKYTMEFPQILCAHVNYSGVILCQEMKELHPLYFFVLYRKITLTK